MAISFVGWGPINTSGANQNFQNSGGAVTPELPTGIQAGDLIVLFCMNNDGTNATGFSASGYADSGSGNGGPDPLEFAGVNLVGVLYKFAGASESNPTVSTSGSGLTNDPSMVLVGVWRNVPAAFFTQDVAYAPPYIANTRNITTGTAYIYPGVTFDNTISAVPSDFLTLVISARPNDYTSSPSDAGGYTIISTETTLGSDSGIVAAYQISSDVTTSTTINEGDFGGGAGGGTAGSTALVVVFESPNFPTASFQYSQVVLTYDLGAALS